MGMEENAREGIAGIPVREAQGGGGSDNEADAILSTTLAAGTRTVLTSGTAEIWKPASATAGAAWTATGRTVTVWDTGHVKSTLAAGTWIHIKKKFGQWHYDGGC